jgi:hypothetical protein
MAKKKQSPTFVVRFVGPGLSPATIPLRAVSDALSAVQDLASGRDPFETLQVPLEQTIGLVDVKSGSANYLCVARSPRDALRNLQRVGLLLAAIESNKAKVDNDHLIASIKAIKSLSDVAKQNDCRVEVSLVGHAKEPMFAVQKGDYRRISTRLFMKGETTINGTIERVGGATDMRCLMRIAGRRRLLYCDVKTKDMVRRLGQHLYENISATGKAIWIHQNWYIYRFTIQDFGQPRLGNAMEAIEQLRTAGLSAWDDVADPEELVRGLRQ